MKNVVEFPVVCMHVAVDMGVVLYGVHLVVACCSLQCLRHVALLTGIYSKLGSRSISAIGAKAIAVRPGLTARTVLERCCSGRKREPHFDTAGHRAQNEYNRKQWCCLSGRPLKPAFV